MPTTKKELRKKSGIDVRNEEQIRKQVFENFKEDLCEWAQLGKLYYVADIIDPILIEMIRREYSDSSVTVNDKKVTVNWAEPEDIQNIKNKIEKLESQLEPILERIKKIREWESQMVMNGGLSMMGGRNEEKYSLEIQCKTIQDRIKELKSSFIE